MIHGLETETKIMKFYQYEETKTKYISKKTGEEKVLKKVERSDDKCEVPKVVHDMLMAKKDKYLLHRFQIQNDKYIWKHILETVIMDRYFTWTIWEIFKQRPNMSHTFLKDSFPFIAQ